MILHLHRYSLLSHPTWLCFFFSTPLPVHPPPQPIQSKQLELFLYFHFLSIDGWLFLFSAAVNSLISLSSPSPWHCVWSPGSDVSWPSTDPCGLYNLAQQALISKSRLLSFTLLCSSHHWATSSTPKGGNNPYPRRTEQSTAGVHRPHMHLVIRAPLFIHHLGQYSGSVLALHHLLAFVCVLCVCLYFSGPY